MSHSESSDAVAPSALKHEDEAALIEPGSTVAIGRFGMS